MAVVPTLIPSTYNIKDVPFITIAICCHVLATNVLAGAITLYAPNPTIQSYVLLIALKANCVASPVP